MSSAGLEQARRGWLAGNDLPARWRGRPRFVLLETDFGFGHGFLVARRAWLDDPDRAERLVYLAIAPHPPGREALARRHADSPLAGLADELIAAWPPATPDLHRLAFDDGRIELLLAFGEMRDWLPEWIAEVDAFLLDSGPTAIASPVWDARACKALGRLAAPGATLAARGDADALRRDLRSTGFDLREAPGQDDPPDIVRATYAPRFRPRRPIARRPAAAGERRALVVGAGLAGCAAAQALAEQGWRSVLMDRAPGLAAGASGNPAGLFHGVVHAVDGPHARFNRLAAAHAAGAVRAALADGVPAAVDGLLRLETSRTLAEMRAVLAGLGWPGEAAQALSAEDASTLAGLALRDPCWFHPAGGWVDPGALSAWFVARGGDAIATRLGVDVACLESMVDGGWRLCDAAGRTGAEAPVVVLANASGAAALLDRLDGRTGTPSTRWPADATRGQLSSAAAEVLPRARRPVAGDGYLLPPVDGRTLFGATSTRDDPEPAVRLSDHMVNVARLERLLGHSTGLRPESLEGRTAWRYSASDRLPIVGAVPAIGDHAGRPIDQPRLVPRRPGLFVLTGLGSRGITWSRLAARVLAGWVTGAPMPMAASLVDAIDPARFDCRQARSLAIHGPTVAASASE